MSSSVILLVEDNEVDVILFKRALSKTGSDVPFEAVEDGEEAIRYLAGAGPFTDREKHPLPSLLILDLKLPKKSGLEVLEWLRAHPSFKELPVLVLTSSSELTDVSKAFELGIGAYLVKPVGFEVLKEMVKAIRAFWERMDPETQASLGKLGTPAPPRP